MVSGAGRLAAGRSEDAAGRPEDDGHERRAAKLGTEPGDGIRPPDRVLRPRSRQRERRSRAWSLHWLRPTRLIGLPGPFCCAGS